MRESASPCGSQRRAASGQRPADGGVGVGVARCGQWARLALTSISSRGAPGICWSLNWPLLGNCTMSPRLARVLTGWRAGWLDGWMAGWQMLEGPPGFETADRIGDCQVQRAGCLIPAGLVAEGGRHEVNSSVSRELGASEPQAPGHTVPDGIAYQPGQVPAQVGVGCPRAGLGCRYHSRPLCWLRRPDIAAVSSDVRSACPRTWLPVVGCVYK